MKGQSQVGGEAILDESGPSGKVAPNRATAIVDEARAIAKEAYIYAFAMIENYQTFNKQVIDRSAPEYIGGYGRFRHYAEPFRPEDRDVTPNNDTSSSSAWLDLRSEPWVLSVPAMPRDRYYVVQWFDLYTHNFASVGARATGFEAGDYLLAGPGWSGGKPPGIAEVFQSETDIVGSATRIVLLGPQDAPNVKALLSKFKLGPLSHYLARPTPRAARPIDFPPYQKALARSREFILYLNFLLQFCQPAHSSERQLMKRFAKIGIGPGAPFDSATLAPRMLAAIDAGVADAQSEIQRNRARTSRANGLFGTREFLKNDYMKRTVGSLIGLYGNSVEEGWCGGYAGGGNKLNAMHFRADGMPPARFFWSLTLYTLPDRFLYANPLQRYSIGDRTEGLTRGADGSLTLWVGHASPGLDREANWLPAPPGPYVVIFRIYGPEQPLLDGSWTLPPLRPASARQ